MAARKKRVNAGMSTQRAKLPAVGDVNAAVRARQALLMTLEGHTYDEIANVCGFRDRSGAYRAVQRELARYRAPDIQQARALELMRLDALMQVYMKLALDGDGWSCDRVLRISERRAKITGMDYAPKPHESDNIAQMVIIGVPPEIAAAV